MPTYEYECTKCAHHFEAFQKIDAKPKKQCPRCRAKVKRLISGGCGLIFKGNGFYITDYKRKGANQEKPKESTAQSSPAKSDEPKKTRSEKKND